MNDLNLETTHPMENHGEVALPDSLLEGIKVTARPTNVTCFVIETSTYRVLHKTSGVHHIPTQITQTYHGIPAMPYGLKSSKRHWGV